MDTKRNGPVVRTAVTKLLRRYFDDLRTRLAAGTSEFWNTVEQRLSQMPEGSAREKQSLQQPMQRQPVQQQQAKAEGQPKTEGKP